jgi:hypothetical protein
MMRGLKQLAIVAYIFRKNDQEHTREREHMKREGGGIKDKCISLNFHEIHWIVFFEA